MRNPFCFHRFVEDKDTILFVFQEKNPTCEGLYFDLTWTMSVTRRSESRIGCDFGSAICSTTCSGTKKGNFFSCSWGLFSSINRYINWDCKKFSQNKQINAFNYHRKKVGAHQCAVWGYFSLFLLFGKFL